MSYSISERAGRLCGASQRGDIGGIRRALAMGASIDFYDSWAARHAAERGHVMAVDYLLSCGGSEHPQSGALKDAIRNNHHGVIELLLEKCKLDSVIL
jgi:hypothetical protein